MQLNGCSHTYTRKMAASIITLAKLYTYTLNSSSEADTSNKFSSEPELDDSLNDHTDGKEGIVSWQTRKLCWGTVYTILGYLHDKVGKNIYTYIHDSNSSRGNIYTQSVFVKCKYIQVDAKTQYTCIVWIKEQQLWQNYSFNSVLVIFKWGKYMTH